MRVPTNQREATKMKITTVGIDLAKNVFQVHGVDQRGKVVVRKRLRRQQVLTFFAQLPACLVGMEACGGAHYWARTLQTQGHTVKLMAPQFVKPYVKANKTDAASRYRRASAMLLADYQGSWKMRRMNFQGCSGICCCAWWFT